MNADDTGKTRSRARAVLAKTITAHMAGASLGDVVRAGMGAAAAEVLGVVREFAEEVATGAERAAKDVARDATTPRKAADASPPLPVTPRRAPIKRRVRVPFECPKCNGRLFPRAVGSVVCIGRPDMSELDPGDPGSPPGRRAGSAAEAELVGATARHENDPEAAPPVRDPGSPPCRVVTANEPLGPSEASRDCVCGGQLWRLECDSYVCGGLEDRAEVEIYAAPNLPFGAPPEFVSKAPCGFIGAADDFGTKWVSWINPEEDGQ